MRVSSAALPREALGHIGGNPNQIARVLKGSGTGGSNISGRGKRYVNGATVDPVIGDLSRIRTDAHFRVALTTGTRPGRPVVVYFLAGTSYAAGAQLLIARKGAHVPVKVTASVQENDSLVPPATPGIAMVNNAITDPKKIIGYALTPDKAGAALAEILQGSR